MRLHDKVVVITGAGSGTGRAMATRFAAEGAAVIAAEWHADTLASVVDEVTQAGGRITGVHGDVSREADCATIIGTATTRYGRLDVLVNNAGINLRGAIDELPLDDFARSWSVNVTGTWLMCRAAKRLLEQSPAARVVNIGSTFGSVAAPNRTAYTSAKGAVHQLTRALAMEWAHIPINVNALAPGPFLTDMNLEHQFSEHSVRVIQQEIALKRWAEIPEITGPLLFLSADASSYVTGSIVAVDGGWTTH